MKQTQYIIIAPDGYTFYYEDSEMNILHRNNGPAIECPNGHKEWWVHGKPLTEEEFTVLIEKSCPQCGYKFEVK